MEYPQRKRLRLPQYDYSAAGCYFLTICTKDKVCSLGSVGRADPGTPWVQLSPLGELAQHHIQTMESAYEGVTVEKSVVMPNHVHLLLTIHSGAPGSARPTQNLSRMVAAFKRLTNRAAAEQLWQPSYYDHVVRNEQDFLRIWNYIDTNPARWAEDEYYL